jgi:hypothetical protein
LPNTMSKDEIREFISPSSLRKIVAGQGIDYISSRTTKIDGIECAEVITKAKNEVPSGIIYLYNITYYLIYKDKFIHLGYSTAGSRESDAKELFEQFKNNFQSLASSVVVLSQWE